MCIELCFSLLVSVVLSTILKILLIGVEVVELWLHYKPNQPFQHTGLVLLFENEFCYTIDYGTENGTIKTASVPDRKKEEFISTNIRKNLSSKNI